LDVSGSRVEKSLQTPKLPERAYSYCKTHWIFKRWLLVAGAIASLGRDPCKAMFPSFTPIGGQDGRKATGGRNDGEQRYKYFHCLSPLLMTFFR
jgi:hypothetical protein